MITPIHFLDPTATVACFRERFEPSSRQFVSRKLLIAIDVQVFGAGEAGVRWCATVEA